jgi:UDP-GlcNAc3NAcA epimerase
MKINTIVGARPQFIKASAISRAFKKYFPGTIKESIIHTGQHYDSNMSKVFFEEMEIPKPAYHLGIGSLSHGRQTGRMTEKIESVLERSNPDAVIVYGDTNSTLAGALAAVKLHIPVIHIEAGLRSYKKEMPEEINRIATDHMSTLLFSPTRQGISNLIREGFCESNLPPYTANQPGVLMSGDVMYDNTLYFSSKAASGKSIEKIIKSGKNFGLVTIHRSGNTDDFRRLGAIIQGLIQIADTSITLVLPMHPRTRQILKKQEHQPIIRQFIKHPNIQIIEPVSYLEMLTLESAARFIITDSGGVQKEAYFLKKPSVILREETEWTEIVEQKAAILAGADTLKIVEGYAEITKHADIDFPDLYGNGDAAGFIVKTIAEKLK